jgi:alginate O-acetyltransferase complex protein AlgI
LAPLSALAMNFISLIYALFLGLTVTTYWFKNNQQHQLRVIVICSLLFYALFYKDRPPLLLLLNISLLVAIIYVNFWIGKLLLESQIIEYRSGSDGLKKESKYLPRTKKDRKLLVMGGIIFNVLVLLAAKYIPFLLTIISSLGLSEVQATANWYRSNVLPPLGISFLTFESIAYLVDVYKGSPATGNLLKYAAYKSFFPKLISGPITHYHEFSPQLNNLKFPPIEVIVEGLWLITCGAVKKTLIADNLATYVNLVWDAGNLERAGSIDLWLAIFAYGWQLYLDFSGYVDIARGSALFFGIKIPENFYFPYLSTNIADFWRRWHITLGDWLRQYIYFPLGGSRQGLLITCRNLLLIMLIAGIWHGADWGFVVWGGLHGCALVAQRLTVYWAAERPGLQAWRTSRQGQFLGWIVTQLFVFMAWIFFRLPKLNQSSLVLQHLWGYNADSQFASKIYLAGVNLDHSQLLVCLLGLSVIMSVIYTFRCLWKIELSWRTKLLCLPIALYTVWLLAPEQSSPYIYFDF